MKNGTITLFLIENFKPVNKAHNFNTGSNASANYFVPHVDIVNTTTFHVKAVQNWYGLPSVIKMSTSLGKQDVEALLASGAHKKYEYCVYVKHYNVFQSFA